MKKYFQIIILLTITFFLTACQRANIPLGSLADPNADIVVNEAELPKFVYLLGAGDKIRVLVFGEEEMSGEFEVGNNGTISLPYIREVKAEGRDVTSLEQNIELRYKQQKILRAPKVSVEVLEYRPYYIHGEVTEGGEFPYKSGMDIRNAVAIAGGYTYRADEDVAYIRREGASSVYKVSLSDNKSTKIYPGDNIQIPERFF